MAPRPIHRWKTFWLGLFILAFLTWAWVTGRTHSACLGVRPGAHTWYLIGNPGGYAILGTNTIDPSVSVSVPRRFDYQSGPSAKPEPWFPPPYHRLNNANTGITWSHHGIALWLLTFLYFLTWATFLLWRSRRLRRLTAQPPHQAATPP